MQALKNWPQGSLSVFLGGQLAEKGGIEGDRIILWTSKYCNSLFLQKDQNYTVLYSYDMVQPVIGMLKGIVTRGIIVIIGYKIGTVS